MSNEEQRTGTVKFFNGTKGYGFIKDDNDGKEYFVHASGLIHEIKENQKVSYFLEESQKKGKGMNAVDVRIN